MVKFDKMVKKAQDTMGGKLKDKYRVKPMFGFYRETWDQYATGNRDENVPIPIPRRQKGRVKRQMIDDEEVRLIQEEDAKKLKKKLEKEYDAGSVLDDLGMGHLKRKKE